MTGYALAFPLNSKYKAMFDEKILELRENGTFILNVKKRDLITKISYLSNIYQNRRP